MQRCGRRRSVRFAALLWAAVPAACASAGTRDPVAVPEPTPLSPRHAPGVAVDPILALPKASETATTDHGVVVLAEPVDTRSARSVVEAFFTAVVDESLDDLSLLCEPNAKFHVSPRSRTDSLVTFWKRRFDRLDYRSLATEVFYRESEMEVHTAHEPATVALSRSLPVFPKRAEVLVRTPMLGTNASRLFGSDIVFLLRPGPSGYKIAEVYEDFRLP